METIRDLSRRPTYEIEAYVIIAGGVARLALSPPSTGDACPTAALARLVSRERVSRR
jgi:hypothetical protein